MRWLHMVGEGRNTKSELIRFEFESESVSIRTYNREGGWSYSQSNVGRSPTGARREDLKIVPVQASLFVHAINQS